MAAAAAAAAGRGRQNSWERSCSPGAIPYNGYASAVMNDQTQREKNGL